MISLHARITAVTVYADRALIVRTASQKIESGEYQLVFDNLPDCMVPESAQVNGRGEAVLKDIKFQQVRHAEIPDEEVKQLVQQQAALNDELRSLQETIAHAQAEKTFIENIAAKLTKGSEKTIELDPDKWMKMVAFYRSKYDALDKEIHHTEKTQRKLKEELDQINKLILDLGHRRNKIRNQVVVTVEAAGATELILFLHYIVRGPSWTPVYDLRVSSAERKMRIAYHAIIRQATTESWEDVEIKLSTARPHISGQQPELKPWYVNVFTPPPPAAERSLKVKAAAPKALFGKADASDEDLMMAEEPVPAVTIPETTVEAQAASVVFVISGSHTIQSDNKDHKVTILIHDLPAEFSYAATPKLAPYAYLKAKVTNQTEFPFLPGKTSIFLDNNFVANAEMGLVAPDETFTASLGVDESMKVEHRLIKKYRKDEGLLSKKTVYRYQYLIQLKNNKKSEEEIKITDQIPISQNKDIAINLIEPKYKEDAAALKKNELNILEWFYKIKPGEEIKIPLTFEVEYPQEVEVTGLG